MWELDQKETWALKNWCFWTVVLEKTLESPLHCKDMKPVNCKGNHSWIFIGRTEAEAETPIFVYLMRRTDSPEKTLMLGRLKVEGEGDNRGWDDWMASLTQWTWVWAISRSWWWTGKSGILQSMGSQRLDTTEWVNWTEWTSFKETGAPLLRERDLLEIQWIDITDNSYVKYIYGKPVTARQSCVWHNMLIDNLMRFTFCVQTIFLNYTNVTNVP